mmetsp:Transcript_11060/g.28319  ORF Transcript_11060/g.28319 Transcript_11060/m.28319 type:complete len:227 (+) Transcript_11060:829-1509(+)
MRRVEVCTGPCSPPLVRACITCRSQTGAKEQAPASRHRQAMQAIRTTVRSQRGTHPRCLRACCPRANLTAARGCQPPHLQMKDRTGGSAAASSRAQCSTRQASNALRLRPRGDALLHGDGLNPPTAMISRIGESGSPATLEGSWCVHLHACTNACMHGTTAAGCGVSRVPQVCTGDRRSTPPDVTLPSEPTSRPASAHIASTCTNGRPVYALNSEGGRRVPMDRSQ